MGQYKVPQDVEAEDKILGPLTFKQFIYAMVGFGWALMCFALFNKIIPVMLILGAPVTIIAMLLAFYRKDGQNFEQLLIAMVGYFSQSRKRIWRKELVVESFHVQPTAAVVEQSQRNPAEVRSQLEQLGSMIDSRGWNSSGGPKAVDPALTVPVSDRLVEPAAVTPAASPSEDEATDIQDLDESPLAQNLAALLQEAAQDVREEAIEQMHVPTDNAVAPGAIPAAVVYTPTTPATVAAAQPIITSLPPLTHFGPPPPVPIPTTISANVTTAAPGDILNLATQRDDLTVAQLAATATRLAPLPQGQTVDIRNNG